MKIIFALFFLLASGTLISGVLAGESNISLEETNDRRNALPVYSFSEYTPTAHAIQELRDVKDEIDRAIIRLLRSAINKNLRDTRFNSPIVYALEMVDVFGVTAAEDEILPIVNYMIDLSSFPRGYAITTSSLFPAAEVLIRLRIGMNKISAFLSRADNLIDIEILTWVMWNIHGKEISIAAMRAFLQSEKNNISYHHALKTLENEESEANFILKIFEKIDSGSANSGSATYKQLPDAGLNQNVAGAKSGDAKILGDEESPPDPGLSPNETIIRSMPSGGIQKQDQATAPAETVAGGMVDGQEKSDGGSTAP